MIKKLISLAMSMGFVALIAVPSFASAFTATNVSSQGLGLTNIGNTNTQSLGGETGLGTKDIRVTVANIINVALGLLGIVAVVIILIGGFEWMTAGGNEEKTGEAKKRIVAGIIGLAIILSAYAIASYVINSLINATS